MPTLWCITNQNECKAMNVCLGFILTAYIQTSLCTQFVSIATTHRNASLYGSVLIEFEYECLVTSEHYNYITIQLYFKFPKFCNFTVFLQHLVRFARFLHEIKIN